MGRGWRIATEGPVPSWPLAWFARVTYTDVVRLLRCASMSAAVVILLAGLWVGILLPGLVRARRYSSPTASVSRFHTSMDRLERTRAEAAARQAGRPPPKLHAGPPEPPRKRAAERRRRIVGTLTTLVALGAALSLVVPPLGAAVLIVSIPAAVGYAALFWYAQGRRVLAQRVHHLDAGARQARQPTGEHARAVGEDPPPR